MLIGIYSIYFAIRSEIYLPNKEDEMIIKRTLEKNKDDDRMKKQLIKLGD